MIIMLEDLRKEKLKHYFDKLAFKEMSGADRIQFKKVITEKFGYRNPQGRKTVSVKAFNISQFAKDTGYQLISVKAEKPMPGTSHKPTYWVLIPTEWEKN